MFGPLTLAPQMMWDEEEAMEEDDGGGDEGGEDGAEEEEFEWENLYFQAKGTLLSLPRRRPRSKVL